MLVPDAVKARMEEIYIGKAHDRWVMKRLPLSSLSLCILVLGCQLTLPSLATPPYSKKLLSTISLRGIP